MSKNIQNQRTYALVGTGGSGKTTLAEMLLFRSGTVNRLGKIEEESTCLDYEPEELRRHGSTQPGFAHFTWNKNSHFLIDTPGDTNFIGDISYLILGSDAVVFVVDAVDGVKPLSRKLWAEVKKASLPAIIFISKMDRDRADFDMTLQSLASLGVKPVILYLPIGGQAAFKGLVEVMTGKAFMFEPDGKTKEAEAPADMAEAISAARETAIENIAESDEALMEKYLEQGELSAEDISQGLRAGVLSGDIIPVCVGAALENKGAEQLLNAIQTYFPDSTQHTPWKDASGGERSSGDSQPVACLVIKTIADPFAGQLSIMRVLSGTLEPDSALYNANTYDTERVGQILLLLGKTQNQTKEPQGPGAIVAVAKLKNTHTGDTLSDEKKPFKANLPALPPTLISYALNPKEKGEEDKVFAAITKLLDEDVNLKLARNEETGDILVSGMGQLHVELAVDKAKRRSKIEIVLAAPKVPYRETIKGRAEVQGRHKKQSGGRGQFGDCWIKMEPMPRGAGYEFVDAIVGGVIPRQYIPAVDKGIQESAQRGFLTNNPVIDFKVTLYDGSYHTVDSSEMAFKIAGSIAFKKAMEQAKPILLEPIALVTVVVPDENMGDVIGDLSSRRGKVLGSESQGGFTEIKVHAPMSEVLQYAQSLSAMTGGQGAIQMDFDHYEEAPPTVAEKVLAEEGKGDEAEDE